LKVWSITSQHGGKHCLPVPLFSPPNKSVMHSSRNVPRLCGHECTRHAHLAKTYNACMRVHTHTHIPHTHTHTRAHTDTHRHTRSLKHTRTHSNTHSLEHTHIHTYAHTNTRAGGHSPLHVPRAPLAERLQPPNGCLVRAQLTKSSVATK